jgi:hypothetical protein
VSSRVIVSAPAGTGRIHANAVFVEKGRKIVNWKLHHMSAWMIAVFVLQMQNPDVVADEVSLDGDRKAVGFALNDIIGDDLVADNVAGIRETLWQLPPEQRSPVLLGHVLPSSTHDTIRLFGMQSPTSPVPTTLISDEPLDVECLRLAAESGHFRVSTGGNVVSPVFDLLRTAQQVGRLVQLKLTVQQLTPLSEHQQRCRLVLLALIELQLGNSDAAAAAAFDEFSIRWQKQKESSLAKRWPETLLLWAALKQSELLNESQAMIFEIIEQQIRKGVCSGPGHWDRLISNLMGSVHHPHNLGPDRIVPALHPYGSPPPLK